MKIAAAYIRVSTDDQTELSPDSQIKQIREYAKKNDMIIPDKYIFADEGISGKDTKKRTAFNKMISIAKTKPKPFECILLWKFSRFARNREDSILYKSLLRKQLGIDVISISENIGDDKMSILIEALIEAMDEYYSINLAEEVKRGMTEKVSRGGVVTCAPFGYDVINNNYIINNEEAYYVHLLFEKYANGASLRKLACYLNDQGIKSKRNGKFENRTVEYILQNPVYIGKVRWNPNKQEKFDLIDDIMIVDGAHVPIIDDSLFYQVQEKIIQNKKLRCQYTKKKSSPNFMLHGLVRCSNCGATLIQTAKGQGLQCHSYSKGKCKQSHYISLSKLNETVINIIESILKTAIVTIQKPLCIKQESETKHIINQEYQKLQRVKTAYEAGIDTLEEYISNKNRIYERISTLEKKIVSEEVQCSLPISIHSSNNTSILDLLQSDTISEKVKNLILRSFIDYIVFNKASNSITIFFYT